MNTPRVSGFTGLRKISAGEQSCLWRAKDIETGKTVAVKVGEEPLSVPLEIFDRYVLGLVAATEHPALVTVHSGGFTDDGAPFIVLDDCDEATIFAEALQEELALDRVLRLMIWLSSGVERLHHEGLVHGALGSEHLMRKQDGEYALAGFAMPGCASGGRLAPEVMRGHDATHASDVFGLGVMAWELVGSAHIPVKLQTLLAAAVADDPAHRLPAVRDLIEGFQRVQKKLGHEVTRADPPVGVPANRASRLEAAANVDDETQLRVVTPDDATRVRHNATWQQNSSDRGAMSSNEVGTYSETVTVAMKPQLMELPKEVVTEKNGTVAFAPNAVQESPSLYKPRALAQAPSAVTPSAPEELPETPTQAARVRIPLAAPNLSSLHGRRTEPVSRIRQDASMVAIGATGVVCVAIACLIFLLT
ncbi:serine/threonine protein kinase [Leucobacter chinensis]|uniref:serine/threonine protein kinase n=1 Tax=Leucobacter chinensis TaxID=2851010 RepID=UPI001C240ABD|nr:protein kinase [Leucobacter chinensis]